MLNCQPKKKAGACFNRVNVLPVAQPTESTVRQTPIQRSCFPNKLGKLAGTKYANHYGLDFNEATDD